VKSDWTLGSEGWSPETRLTPGSRIFGQNIAGSHFGLAGVCVILRGRAKMEARTSAGLQGAAGGRLEEIRNHHGGILTGNSTGWRFGNNRRRSSLDLLILFGWRREIRREFC
jgi:hypothetical protein